LAACVAEIAAPAFAEAASAVLSAALEVQAAVVNCSSNLVQQEPAARGRLAAAVMWLRSSWRAGLALWAMGVCVPV
jgi:hypothetical protein